MWEITISSDKGRSRKCPWCHIPWLNSNPFEKFQNQINISPSFTYKCLSLIRISTSRKQTKWKAKASLLCCVLIHRSIYRLLAKHPSFWFKHLTTETKNTVPVLSTLKMFQSPMSNPISYWACSLHALLNPLPTTTHTHGVNCSNLSCFIVHNAFPHMQLAQAATIRFISYTSLIQSHKSNRTLYSVNVINHCQQLVMLGSQPQ